MPGFPDYLPDGLSYDTSTEGECNQAEEGQAKEGTWELFES